MEAAIFRCLEKEPGKRFQTIDELDKALAQCDCAGQWGEEQAAAWWQGRAAKETDAELARLSGPTAPMLAVHGYVQQRDRSLAEG